MNDETMNLMQLAAYLHRDAREVSRLAEKGELPGRRVAGDWRFSRAEVNHWLETQLGDLTDQQLTQLEGKPATEDGSPLLTTLIMPACVAVPLRARTRASALSELVDLAGQSGQVVDADAVLAAVKQREDLLSTALEGGIAVPHPRRPLPAAIDESVVAYGRTLAGIPFGAPDGRLTDIFFLICCRDDRTHLRVLARLSRLILRKGFVESLRAAETAEATLAAVTSAENRLTQQ